MLILASASPRRAEILTAAGITFTRSAAAGIDESLLPGERPRDYVTRLARQKAEAVAGDLVLAADTTVVVDDELLGKPADAVEAAAMLRRLSGRAHEVITGICLRSSHGAIVDAESTRVWVAPLTEDEIAAYVSSGEPMDKAGAYGIQGLASKFVERIEGCYFNVMGLPVALVYKHLRSLR
jgi:septum formation protein